MTERTFPSDDQIQDYIDGRLSECDRVAFAAYLLADPDTASKVETLRHQNEALTAVGQEILDEPVPPHLLDVVRGAKARVVPLAVPRPSRPLFLEAAAAILLFCTGGVVGWFASQQLQPVSRLEDMIASEAAKTFAFYAEARDYPIDFPPERGADLASWLGKSFGRDIPPPDLTPLAYDYSGGRLLPSAGERSGFFQFDARDGNRIAVFFWAADRPPSKITDVGQQTNVSARYWFRDGLSFAVMGDIANPDLDEVANMVFSFYEQALDRR